MNDPGKTNGLNAERFEIVRSADRLAAIGPAWTALWHRLDGLIFQSHAWVSAWWDTLPSRDQRALRIGLAWRDEVLVAIVPLAISRRKGLRFLEWAAASYTDYGDILLAPECPQSTLQDLWIQLSASGGFDLAYINRLLPDAAARKLLTPGMSGGIKLRPNHRQEVSHRVNGQGASGKAWYDGQSKKTRKSYRHGVNIIEEIGHFQFRLLPPEEPRAPLLERLSALKRKSLALRDQQSELFDQDAPALAALVEVLARAGTLRIFVLECNGLMIATSINFVEHDTMMAFVTTFDPDFGRASPGSILMIEYIRWSFDHGLQVVDFLCGGEAFKQRFATESVTLQSCLGTRTVQGMIASQADRIRQAVRSRRNLGHGSDPAISVEPAD